MASTPPRGDQQPVDPCLLFPLFLPGRECLTSFPDPWYRPLTVPEKKNQRTDSFVPESHPMKIDWAYLRKG